MQCYSGASNGINKNFETVQDVLKDFVSIRDASKAPAAKVSSMFDASGYNAFMLQKCICSYPACDVCIAAFCACQEGRALS